MSIELVHIGFGNILAMSRTIAIASPNSAPTKRIIHDGRSNGKVIDMTSGRRTKAVIFTDSGHIVLAALAPETIASRFTAGRSGITAKQDPADGSEGADEE
jgi:extracellular matrix regulatory protein A